MADRAPTSEKDDLITSRDNRWLKRFRAALRGTGPAEGEPIGIEGLKLVEDALRSGLEAEAVLVCESAEPALDAILRAASATEAGIPRSRILRTTDKLFAGVAGTETPQGIAALFHKPDWQFEDILRGAADENGARFSGSPLVVVMAGVRDPGNVGTIVRSAEAFGATGAIAARGTADPWSPKALRASAVSALRLPVLRGIAIPVLLAQLKMARVKIIAAIGRGVVDSRQDTGSQETPAYPDLREASAIFVGNEGAGLAPEVLHSAEGTISIPMHPSVESLNAGVAASIALFEAARQRRGTR
ncbi:MAG TPA: RNA methyltransferase [Candidatus Acidoferrales bacterium]|jgi:TrmH family RNA methyltransferase